MANRLNESAVLFVSRFCEAVSALSVLFGILVLTGWALHVQILKSFLPGHVAVKANTALCFILLGFALWIFRKQTSSSRRAAPVVSGSLALFAGVIGLLSFFEYWAGWDLHIDHLIFAAGVEDLPGSARPGLMSPLAGASFLLLGMVVILLYVKERWAVFLQNSLASTAIVISCLGLLDFPLNPQHTHTYISPVTALLILLYCFSVLCCRHDCGLGALIVSATPGGELCRRLLPPGVFIPLLIAWLRWKGEEQGLLSDWTGLAIMAVSAGILLATVIVWTALARPDGCRAAESRSLGPQPGGNRQLVQ